MKLGRIKRVITGILVYITFLTTLNAQYSLEWQVYQDVSEVGIIYFDFNDDGINDIVKVLYNTMTVYDGGNNFDVTWEITDEDYDYLTIWDVYHSDEMNMDFALIYSTTYDPAYRCKISAWPILGTAPLWETDETPGAVYFLDYQNLDSDNEKEILFGVNDYDSETTTYTSKIYILDSTTGTTEWESSLLNGYIAGPYVGNIDTDPQKEIVYNLYDYENELYTLNVLQCDESVSVIHHDLPNDFIVGRNFPNPFNPMTQIPIAIVSSSNVTVKIYTAAGQEIFTLCDKYLTQGNYQFTWFGHNQRGNRMPTGVYYYRVETDTETYSRPMVLLK